VDNPILSILICSTSTRKVYLDKILEILNRQKNGQEILINSDDVKTIGEKRNELIDQAKGKYIVFVDDDDLVSDDYVTLILDAAKNNCDVVGIHLIYTRDGQNPQKTYHSLKYDHWFQTPDPKEPGKQIYYRNPNHLNPVKREYALKARFPHKSFGEDKDYSMALLPFLKTEIMIEKPIYFYLYRTKK